MKDNLIEESKATAEPAKTEEENAAAELGKFKSVKALKDAYTALEAEFTRRSQRLKELETNKEKEAPASAVNANSPSQTAQNGALPAAYAADKPISDEVRNAVIEEYLNGVRTNRAVPFVMGGGAVTAVRRTPSTIREAGDLAAILFKKTEDI